MNESQFYNITNHEFFVGRTNELQLLKEILNGNNVIQITGLGGIGKTALVKQFLNINKEGIDYVYWLDYHEIENNNSISQKINELKAIDNKLLPLNSESAKESLRIIVIDDITIMNHEVASIIDLFSVKWKVLITSRTNISDQIPSLTLPFLTQNEAFLFFKTYVNKWDAGDIQNQKYSLFRLLEFSGLTPLAIEMIINVINQRDIRNVEEIENLLQGHSNLSLYFPNKPIGIYLDTDDIEKIEEAYDAVKKYLSNKEIEIEYGLPPKRGSWFKRLFTKGKDVISSPEFRKRIEEAEHAIKLKTIKKEQSKIDKNQSEAVSNIINATEAIPNIAINIGSLLIVKVTDSNGISNIAVKSLSISEMIAIEKNPDLLQAPSLILDQLKEVEPKQIENNA